MMVFKRAFDLNRRGLCVPRLMVLALCALLAAGAWPTSSTAQVGVADGCYMMQALMGQSSPRFLAFDSQTRSFSLAQSQSVDPLARPPVPLQIRRVADWGYLIALPNGEYLRFTGTAPSAVRVGSVAGVYGTGMVWDIVPAGSPSLSTIKLLGSYVLQWSSVQSGPSATLTASFQGLEQWALLPATGCPTPGPVANDPVFYLERSNLAEGCFGLQSRATGRFIEYAPSIFDPLGFGTGYSRGHIGVQPNGKFYLLALEAGILGNATRYLIMDAGGFYMFANPANFLDPEPTVGRAAPLASDLNQFLWEVSPPNSAGFRSLRSIYNGLFLSDTTHPLTSLVQQKPYGGITQEWFLAPTACTPPGTASGIFSLTQWYQSNTALPPDAIQCSSVRCYSDQALNAIGTPTCTADTRPVPVTSPVFSSAPGMAPEMRNIIYGWHSGAGHGSGQRVVKDNMDRCALAHDAQYWANSSIPVFRNNDINLVQCALDVVPQTRQENRAKTAMLVSPLALLNGVVFITGPRDVYALPNDRQLYEIVHRILPAPGFTTGLSCPPVLDPTAPNGWKPHPACLPSQTVQLCPAIPGDINQDCRVDAMDLQLIQVGQGGLGCVGDRRDLNGDMTVNASDMNIVTARNGAPVANAGPDQTVEATSPSGATILLDGSFSSDPEGLPLTYQWTWSGGTASGPTPSLILPKGTQAVTLTTTDALGKTATDTLSVKIQDTTPPAFSFVPANMSVNTTSPVIPPATATDVASPPATVTSNAPAMFPPGVTTVTWTATDGAGNRASATTVITVANAAPAASADNYFATANQVFSIGAPGVLANDTDPQSTPLTAILVSGPSNGTLSLNADGSFAYTPAAGFRGIDRFSYKANDGALDSNPAWVSITVTSGEAFRIIAAPSSQTVLQGVTATYTLTIIPFNGFNGSVSLSHLNAGSQATIVPASVVLNGAPVTATLHSPTSMVASPGSGTITIAGTSGPYVRRTTVTKIVTVNPNSPGFTMTVTPDQPTVVKGSPATFTVVVTPVNGFTGRVTLNQDGAGTGASFSPQVLDLNGTGAQTSRLTSLTSASTPSGTRRIAVVAIGNGLRQIITTTVAIQ